MNKIDRARVKAITIDDVLKSEREIDVYCAGFHLGFEQATKLVAESARDLNANSSVGLFDKIFYDACQRDKVKA